MPRVIACVDSSAYALGVCDQAAWFAGRIDGDITVLNVREEGVDARAGAVATSGALDRLADEGAVAQAVRMEGDFASGLAGLAPDLIVMGKRGETSEAKRRLLGSNVEAVIRASAAPVCLAARRFLPILRVLVLLDANMQHRRAVEFVASHPGLRGLDTDLIVAAAPGEPAAEKLAWARGELTADSAEVFAVEAEGLDEAVSLYRASRSADLIVVSRPVLLPSLRQRSRRIDENGMWGFRTPVLVC